MKSALLTTLLLWLIAITVMDLRSRKVRNWMVLAGLATGTLALFNSAQPLSVAPLAGLQGMLIAFIALLPFYIARWMGAGDVKFAAVVGLWFGLTSNLLLIWIGGSLLAGLHGMAAVGWRRLQLSSYGGWLQAHLPTPLAANFAPPVIATGGGTEAGSPRVTQRRIPYAGYMAIAAIWVVLRTGPGPTN